MEIVTRLEVKARVGQGLDEQGPKIWEQLHELFVTGLSSADSRAFGNTVGASRRLTVVDGSLVPAGVTLTTRWLIFTFNQIVWLEYPGQGGNLMTTVLSPRGGAGVRDFCVLPLLASIVGGTSTQFIRFTNASAAESGVTVDIHGVLVYDQALREEA